jgi:cytochrome c oxidase subunit 4
MTNVPPRVYFRVFAGLIILLAITAFAARFDLGIGNTLIALGVAIAKALLILIFFMHLGYSRGAVRLAAAGGLFWLGLLFALSLSDYFTRGAIGVAGK